MPFIVKGEGRSSYIVLLWRRWHRVPEVDRVFVCVLSTLPLQAPPPCLPQAGKGRQITQVTERSPQGRTKGQEKSIKYIPPRPAKLSTPSQTKVWEGLKALNLSPVGREGNFRTVHR